MKVVLCVTGIYLMLGLAAALAGLQTSGEHTHGTGAHTHSHVQNLKGYDELTEAVLLRKMNLLQTQLDALETRVTELEEQ